MDILQTIAAHKQKEVQERKELYPVKLLEKSIYFSSSCVSLKKYLLRDDLPGIIAEFKRKSPSKGFINKYADVERTTIGYMQAGASALSVLTDIDYFGGRSEDLTTARKFNFCPVLRKDFILDEYQVIEARSIGADAILLIAAILEKKQIASLSKLAHELGMEVILEIHCEEELEKVIPEIQIVGVNNRNLKTMEISL
jgi:indole-3-glycerol phosphate synthase